MKQRILFWLLLGVSISAGAQSTAGTKRNDGTRDDVAHDSLTVTDGHRLPESDLISFEGRNYREYDGFLLDMDAWVQPVLPAALVPPSLLYNPFANYDSPATDLARRFQPGGKVAYGWGPAGGFSDIAYGRTDLPGAGFFPATGIGLPGSGPFGFGPAPHAPDLRSATFRLKNGWRITTYGEYDADGCKVARPALLPHQRNAFNGAFEMKSENGNFGFRIGVQRY